ncbi:MAG: PEP-CTERM sorting domain-containing protein [Cyanobacteria bacterium J06635_10]
MNLFHKLSVVGIGVASSVLGIAADPAQAVSLVSGSITKSDNRTAEVDYWKFILERPNRGERTIIDVNAFGLEFDNEISELDPHIRLFKDDGSLDIEDAVRNSNNPNDLKDPFLSIGRNGLDAGDYILAISSAGLSVEEAVKGVNTVGRNRQGGNYTIEFSSNISNVRAVPEPTSMLGILAVTSIGAASLKRKFAKTKAVEKV